MCLILLCCLISNRFQNFENLLLFYFEEIVKHKYYCKSTSDKAIILRGKEFIQTNSELRDLILYHTKYFICNSVGVCYLDSLFLTLNTSVGVGPLTLGHVYEQYDASVWTKIMQFFHKIVVSDTWTRTYVRFRYPSPGNIGVGYVVDFSPILQNFVGAKGIEGSDS